MQPIALKNPTVRLSAPREGDPGFRGEMGPLDAVVEEGVFYSFWRPEPEELAALNRGAPIRLGVFSRAHPPVNVGVIDDQDPDYPGVLSNFDEEKEN